MLVVEEEWLYLCEQGTARFGYRRIEDYPDAASLSAFSEQSYAAIRAYLEKADETKLASSVTTKMPGPDASVRTLPIWYVLSHVLFHSGQHRHFAAVLLTQCGHSPGFIDFIGHDW